MGLESIKNRWTAILEFSRLVTHPDTFPYVHTGWAAQPHTLGARLCALRSLLLWDMKVKIWEDALPKPPSDGGVVRNGKVVSLNRFAAEAAAAGSDDRSKKLMFEQLFVSASGTPTYASRKADIARAYRESRWQSWAPSRVRSERTRMARSCFHQRRPNAY